jgi:membrane peptidoglycan carboxypeptidase
MRKRDHNLLTNAASLLICGLLAGVVVAAAAFPAVAMSGLVAKAGAHAFDQLPTELKDQRAPQITRVFASDNKTLVALLFDEFRSDIRLKDIAPVMQQAIIAAEDHDFRTHNGVDVKGVARAFVANKNGQTKQGASTITMQYVRMSIAYSATKPQEVVDATEDTIERKFDEMRYALQVEKELTKDQILERYLNIAPFGNGAYGVYAASQVYFGKRPKDLKIEEAALLAGLVKAPSAFNPATVSGYPQALVRRDYVIDNMVDIGAITAQQAAAAKAAKLKKTVKRAGNGCVSVPKNNWGFFCDYFYRWWMDQETFGATTYDRERRLKSGGYRIVTSMSVKAQKAAHTNIQKMYKTSPKHPHALMEAAVEPGTGRVRALAVNRNFKIDDPSDPENRISTNPDKKKKKIRGTYPNTTNPLLSGGGDINGYQGGSVFKMFTLVAALEKGYPLSYTINAKPTYKSKYIVEYNSPAACPGTNKYCPKNAGAHMSGVRNMWTGFGMSVNTFFIPLEERAGAANVVDVAKRLGIKFRADRDAAIANNKDGADQWGAFTLGVSATTPLDLANAYATLAADGKYCEPIPVQEIRDHSGTKLDVANPRCKRAISEDVARAAVDAGRCPLGDQSAFGGCNGATARVVRNIVGHPVFGKSGTTDQDKTAVLIAGTKSLVVAGMLADPDWSQTNHRMEHPIVNPAVYNTLRDAMKGQPKQDFEKPTHKMAYGDQRDIPDIGRCPSPDEAANTLRQAGFEVEIDRNNRVDSSCPEGDVAGTSPDGQTIKGGVVVIELSNGRGAEQPETPRDGDNDNNDDDDNGRPGRPGRPGNPD